MLNIANYGLAYQGTVGTRSQNSAAERRMRESGRQRQQGKWQEFGRKGKNEGKRPAKTAEEEARIRPRREEQERAADRGSLEGKRKPAAKLRTRESGRQK